MNQPSPQVERVLSLAGPRGEPPSQEFSQEIQRLIDLGTNDAAALVAKLVKTQREVEHARRHCESAARAATKLEDMLAQLLDSNSLLCHLEGAHWDGEAARAICTLSGHLRELPVHPNVTREQLETLEPWDYVQVNSKEMVVTGVRKESQLYARAHGDIVEMQGYVDREQGLVRVTRQGHDEDIVQLAEPLRAQDLSTSTRLVLHRDASRWAIASLPSDRPESKFETPIDKIKTRLDDLAGMESLLERLVKDILLRLLRPELREQFDLDPLRGVLLYSYKPGMGKTALVRALARWLHETGQQWGFDVVLYIVKPNELKNMWHGGDAKLVREELCGSIRARQALPRSRPLVQVVVLDEIDSLGKRAGGDDGSPVHSSAQNDAVQALLAEMDGMIQPPQTNGSAPSHVLWFAMTNRPDMVDDALKRPGRFGDLMLELPDITIDGAENIMEIYARKNSLPWHIHGEVRANVASSELRSQMLRPALETAFPMVVLKCFADGQTYEKVTAGQVLAGVHYRDAVNFAKRSAATRQMMRLGVPGVVFEDVLEGLIHQAWTQAKALAADGGMLRRQLRWKQPIARVELTPREQMQAHRFVQTGSEE